jgi:predicted DNA-binding transcriptional regulator YafY
MLETSARLLRLLSLLQMPREWTGAQLAERLRVSSRTVRNDIGRLRDLGYPVHAVEGAAGGYRLGAGASLPPLLLDDEEAVAVTVGLRAAATGSIAGVEESSLRALAKIEQVLPSRLRRRVSALQSFTVTIPPDQAAPTVDAAVLGVITAACRDRERLRFDYRSHDGAQTRREAEPLRLVTWGRRWFLVAWDAAREDWRTFRVDRMTLKTPNGRRFPPRDPPAADLAAYVARGVSAAAWRYQARLVVHAPADVVAARLPASVGPVEAIDDRTCQVTTGADSVETLALWAGLLEADFDVIGCPELVARLELLARRYARASALPGPAR